MIDETVSSSDQGPVEPVATGAGSDGSVPVVAEENAAVESSPEETTTEQVTPIAEEPIEEGSVAAIEQESDDDDEFVGEVKPLELVEEKDEGEEELKKQWYILKVQVNREGTISDALRRRVKVEGLERYFGDIVVPTEDIVEFTKSGKKRIVKKKIYPGYIVVHMVINDDTWFLVRETSGIGDFTGSAGKPTPMLPHEVARIVKQPGDDEDEGPKKMAIPFKPGDRVRVKEGYFQNFEGDVDTIDEANGRITVMINIFGRSTPVELEHWQVEAV